jgi:competence protein ComEC
MALAALRVEVGGVRPDRLPPEIDLRRPLEAMVVTFEPWRLATGGWSARGQAIWLRQGARVFPRGPELFLYLAGEETPPPAGARLRVAGYLERGVGFANERDPRPGPFRLAVKSRRLLAVEHPPGRIWRLSAVLRGPLEERLAATSGRHPGLALARALLLGDRRALPADLERALARAGLSHLLALSGLHLALLAGVVELAGTALPRGPRLGAVAATAVLVVLMAGPWPSLVRAAVMAMVAVMALALERPPAVLNGLALAVLVLVLVRPAVMLEAAFRLTVAATAGLLCLAPELAARWSRPRGWLPAGLARALAVTVAAQLTTLPWTVPLFHGVPVTAPLTNLVAVPWASLMLAGSWVWAAAVVVDPGAAAVLVTPLDALARPALALAELPAGPWWMIPWKAGATAAGLVAAGLTLALLAGGRWRAHRVHAVALAAVGGGLGAAWPPPPPAAPEVVLLDIGQGDAVLLRDGRRALLVDGGGRGGRFDVGARVVLPALLGLGVRRLEAALATHPDEDHCRGLVGLAAFLPVGELWLPAGWPEEGCGGDLAAVPGPRRVDLAAGVDRRWGRFRLRVLHPPADGLAASTNDRSLVLLAEACGHRALLTGDITGQVETRLLRDPALAPRVDLLKVAHHGSKSSTGERFLEVIGPRLALISAGADNPYGHPSRVVLARLAGRRIPVARTDRDGLIRVQLPCGGPLRVLTPFAPKPVPLH